MAIFRRRSKTSASDETPGLVLPVVVECFTRLAPRWEEREVDRDLLRARLGDHCRTVELLPVDPHDFAEWTSDLDAESFRRLVLAVSAFEDDITRELLVFLSQTQQMDVIVRAGLVPFARESELLTMSVLRQSELRIEELARKLAHRLGVGIWGETEAQSLEELEHLDYGRLLEEAEKAKVAAEDRMTYLRERQEELRRRRPSGKW